MRIAYTTTVQIINAAVFLPRSLKRTRMALIHGVKKVMIRRFTISCRLE
jgi:hypothetical protein